MATNKKLGIWILLGVFIGLPVILCGGVGVWWVGRNAVAQAKLDQEIEALRAAGYPVDDRSMTQYHAQLTDDFYTAKWLEVLGTLESQQFRDDSKTLPVLSAKAEIPSFDQPWTQQTETEQFLAKYADAVKLIHEISVSDTPVRFPIEFDSFNTLLENTQAIRTVNRLMTLEHEVAIRTDNAEREHQAIQAMLGSSIAIRGEPILVSQLVSVALHGIAVGAIQKSVQFGNMTDEQLRQLMERLAIFDDYQSMIEQGYAGERAMALPIYQDPTRFSDTSQVGAFGSRPIDALYFLRLLKKFEAIEKDDLNMVLAEGERLEAEFQSELENAGFVTKLDTVLTGLTTPALGAYMSAIARQVMQNRFAKLGITIRRHQLETGDLPDNLDALEKGDVKLESLTALDGDSFGYRKDSSGAILWGYDMAGLGGLQAGQIVPSEPPVTDPNQGGTEANEIWLWRFDPMAR